MYFQKMLIHKKHIKYNWKFLHFGKHPLYFGMAIVACMQNLHYFCFLIDAFLYQLLVF